MTVTDIASKFRDAIPDPSVTLGTLERADAEISRIGHSPNELLPRLLDAGCVITFSADEDGTEASVMMPDKSFVKGHGPAPVYALVDAYSEGAWLADFPAVLADVMDA
jgi:hypothetical protein